MNPDAPLAPVPDALIALLLPKKEPTSQVWKQDRHEGSVIDAFNARSTIYEQLERHGYLRAGNERYKRPGGQSASVVVLEGARSYHHSSSDALHSNQTHDAFSIFCHFDYAGDVKAAVKAAAALLGMQQTPHSIPSSACDAPTGTFQEEMEVLNTDAGNARRLVGLFGRDIRYCPEWKSWLVWNGRCWEHDTDDLRLMRMAKRTVQSLYREAQAWIKKLAEEQDEQPGNLLSEEAEKHRAYLRKANGLLSWAVKSEGANRLHAMITLARSEPGIPVSPALFDQHPYLLNVANGTLDLRTGELRGHQEHDYLTICLAQDYDPRAACPRWEQFLTEVLATRETVAFIKRAAGYSLTGDTREQVFFFLCGRGGNGKSTLINTLLRLLAGYGHKASIETFMLSHLTRSGSTATPDLAELPGKRFVSPGEVEQGQRLNEKFIKDLVGADPQAARQLFEHQFEFIPQCKLWMYGNYEPRIKGQDTGIWRRVRYIPFKSTFKDEPEAGEKKKDGKLPEKLQAELPGILAWAVEGCLAWQREGLGTSKEIVDATKAYKENQDILAPFLADRCLIAQHAKAKKADLWDAYLAWLKENAEGDKFVTSHAFSREMKARGFEDDVKIGGIRYWGGIGLLVDPTSPPPPHAADPTDGQLRNPARRMGQLRSNMKILSAQAHTGLKGKWGNLGQLIPYTFQVSTRVERNFLGKVAPSCPNGSSRPDWRGLATILKLPQGCPKAIGLRQSCPNRLPTRATPPARRCAPGKSGGFLILPARTRSESKPSWSASPNTSAAGMCARRQRAPTFPPASRPTLSTSGGMGLSLTKTNPCGP